MLDAGPGRSVRAELLDEELGSGGMHLVPKVADPIRLCRPSSRTALATANHPVKPAEPSGKVDRFEQRFDREEAERGRDPRKMRDAMPASRLFSTVVPSQTFGQPSPQSGGSIAGAFCGRLLKSTQISAGVARIRSHSSTRQAADA